MEPRLDYRKFNHEPLNALLALESIASADDGAAARGKPRVVNLLNPRRETDASRIVGAQHSARGRHVADQQTCTCSE